MIVESQELRVKSQELTTNLELAGGSEAGREGGREGGQRPRYLR